MNLHRLLLSAENLINFVRKVAMRNARIVDAHVNIHDSPQKLCAEYLPSETGEETQIVLDKQSIF